MNKQALTEADIRTTFITPALIGTNGEKWNVMTQIREEAYFTSPHNSDTGPGDVDHLLPEYEKLLAQIAEPRAKLKQELHRALTKTNSR
jgi:hypothetical protein